jgi:hypothetical protein
MDNPDQRPNVINIILASNPSFSPAPGVAEMLESQEDFQIVARPERAEQLFPVMDKRIAPVLVGVAGFYSFPGIAQVAARSDTRMIVLVDADQAAEGQIQYLEDVMKENGIHGFIFDNVANADLIDCVRKVA